MNKGNFNVLIIFIIVCNLIMLIDKKA